MYDPNEDEKTEEDKIIDIIEMEGSNSLFEDTDFIPNRQSLYENEGFIPFYDVDYASKIVWRRPHDIASYPCYFSESFGNPYVFQGTLPDEVFLGVLMAICTFEDYELVENVINSRPDDFKQYGVFTCRFYVEGEWVEVITDTRIPCLMDEDDDRLCPVYSRSPVRKEMWVCLVEKAYAKALGSYEAISKVKVHEALMHLTGGSVQEIRFTEDHIGDAHKLGAFWTRLKIILGQHALVLASPTDLSETGKVESSKENDEGDGPIDGEDPENYDGIVPNRLYTVISYKEVGMNELVLLRCPWLFEDKQIEWEGDWSDSSSKWDEYPDVLAAVHNDPNIPWRRSNPNGMIWLAYKDFMKLFSGIYTCKLFKGDSPHCNYYCAKGEWRDKQAGGPIASLRDREEGSKIAQREEARALSKASAAVIVDGDPFWFNNPQYRLRTTSSTVVNISLTPVNVASEEDGMSEGPSSSSLPLVAINVVEAASNGHHSPVSIGDCLLCHVTASDKAENVHKVKGQEASIWNLHLHADSTYFIVPNTARKSQRCGYVLRVFSSEPIVLERVPVMPCTSVSGEWTKSSHTDSTGGPPKLTVPNEDKTATKKTTVVENPKWCQNPQFHLKVEDDIDIDEVYVKIVVRRVDKVASSTRQTTAGDAHREPNIGLVVCKPEIQEEMKTHSSKIGKPRVNPFGEVIQSKPSSLKKPSSRANTASPGKPDEHKVERKIALNPLYWSQTSTFVSKTESCLYFPKIPRAWMPDGMIVVPCLGDKNVRGSFELDVFSNCNVTIEPLPETTTRSVAGEWVEGSCGGSHICPTYKKNPRFVLTLRPPVVRPGAPQPSPYASLRISLSKTGSSWRALTRKDAVGCMGGFYVFLVTHNEHGNETMRPIYESTFAPTEEVSTETGFNLEYLHGSHDSYVIMPTTFDEGKHGSFVLSVSADCDFSLIRESASGHAPHGSHGHK